jgi:hypothetical protein
MKCFLGKFRDLDTPCDEQNCAMWNNKRGECAIRSYCEAYLSMGLATLKLANSSDRLEKEMRDEYNEDD